MFALAEVVIKTDEAQTWEAANPKNRLARLQDENGRASDLKAKGFGIVVENGVIILRTPWKIKAVKSKSIEERDATAAQALFEKANQLITEWNKKFGITNKSFGGVEYVKTEGGWSDTEGPSLANGNKRSYKAGGTAMGYILVDPQ